MSGGKHLNVDMRFTADTSQAKSSIQELNRLLDKALNQPSIGLGGSGISAEINKAKIAATELKVKLQDAMRTDGSLDLVKFNNSLQTSGKTLGDYGSALSKLGANGKQAFLQLTQSISTANISLERSNGMVNQMWTTLKNVARFQISSSVIHTLVGGISSAYGYAQNLNESLNNIRIVTNQSAEEMSLFADRANKAARSLSSTTLDYTNASLIYYQQGLTDEEVARRTETTLKLANVSRQTAETVSDQMTAIWNNFAKGVTNLEYYADVITALGAATASSSDEIATGVSKFAAVADTVGLSYEYATTALATLVAETRQSADTVGNGLRTLFTRFQSLKMGETLEDGTGLTKYSEALATAGVNIKNQNGELKDMDQILNELGAKWETLNKDQQVALAQTVGGVRQYVNLIALMDNWDKFQINLDIAEGSEGTLNKQAEVYAESWEAARDRVKASAEAIYKSLINDEFFIDVNDFISKNLDGINNLIKALGGLPGVLSIVSTAFLTIFGPQLSQSIDNLVQRIKFLSGQTQKEIIAMKQEANNKLANMYTGATHTKGQVADVAYKSQAAYSNTILEQQLNKKKQLSEEEANIVKLLQEQHNILVQNTIAAGEELEKAQKQFELESARISNMAQRQSNNIVDVNNKQFWDSSSFDDILGKLTSVDTKEIQEGFKLLKQEIKAVEDAAHSGKQTIEEFLKGKGYSNEAIKAFQTLQTSCAGVKDTLKSVEANAAKVVDRFLELKNTSKEFNKNGYDTQISNLQKYEKELAIVETTMQSFTKIDFSNTTNNLTSFEGIINGIEQSTKQFGLTIDEVYGANTQKLFDEFKAKFEAAMKDPSKGFDEVNQAAKIFFDTIKSRSGELGTDIQGSLDKIREIIKPFTTDIEGAMKALEDHFNNVQGESKDVVTGFFNMSSASSILKKLFDEAKGSVDTLGQSLTKFASGLMALSSIVNTIKGLKETWNDASKSMTDKILSTSAAFGTLLFSANRLFEGFKSGITLWVKAGEKIGTLFFTAEKAAAVAATTMGVVAVVIAAVGAAIYLWYQHTHKARKEYEDFLKTVDKSKEEFEKAAEKYNELKSTFEDYVKARDGIDQLTEGTKEWRDAIEDTNEKALKLVELWPELASKFQIDNNGAIIFNNADIEQAIRDSKIAEAQSQLDYIRNDYIAKQMAVEATRESVKNSGFLGSQAYTDDQINNILKIFTDSPVLSTFFDSIYKQMQGTIVEAQNTVRQQVFKDNSNLDYDTKQNLAIQAAQQYAVDTYKERLQALNIDEETINTIFSVSNENILSLLESLYEQREVIEPLVDAQNALNDAQRLYGTEINTAILKINQALGAENSGLASALMVKQLKDIENNDTLSDDQKMIKRNKVIDNVQEFIDKAQELASQLDNNQEKINTVIQVLLGNLPSINLDNYNKKDIDNMLDQHDLFGMDAVEFIPIWEKIKTQFEKSFEDIFKNFPALLKEQSGTLFNRLKESDVITPEQFKKIGNLLSNAMTKGNNLDAFKQLKQLFENAGEGAGSLADKLSEIDWQNITIEELSSILEEAGVNTKSFTTPLQKVIDLMKEVSSIGFDDLAGPYKEVKAIIDKLQYGGDISGEDYDKLKAYSQDSNYQALLDKLFDLQMTGDYTFNGTSSEQLLELFNTLSLEKFREQLDLTTEGLEKLQEVTVRFDDLINKENIYNHEDYTESTNYGNELLQYLNTLKDLGYDNGDKIIGRDQLNTWSDTLQNSEDLNVINKIIDEILIKLKEVGNQDQIIEKGIKDLTAEQEKFNDAIKNQPKHQFDEDVKNQLAEQIKLLEKYGKTLYGISNIELMDPDQLALIAEELLRVDAAAKRFQSSWQKWAEAFNNQQFSQQILIELEDTYKDLLNLGQDVSLSESFLTSQENALKLRDALDGDYEAYLALVELVSDDTIYQMSDTIKQAISDNAEAVKELFNFNDEDFQANLQNLTDAVLQTFDEIQDEVASLHLNAGDIIDDEGIITKLNNLLEIIGVDVQTANKLFQLMGFNATFKDVPPQQEEVPGSITETEPATYTYDLLPVPEGAEGSEHIQWKIATHAESKKIPTKIADTSPGAHALQIETLQAVDGTTTAGGEISRQKLSNTSSGYTPRTSGGGSSRSPSSSSPSSSSSKSPRSLTKYKKADVNARYHTIKEYLSDTEKDLSEATRKKERSYGETRLQYLSREIELRKQALVLQQQQTAEMQKYLSVDKQAAVDALKKFGLNIQFDSRGVITNYEQLYDKLLDLENSYIDQQNSYNSSGDDIPEYLKEQVEAIAEAKTAITQYETTLNGLEDSLYATAQAIDELNDALLEQVTTKVNFKLDINNDEAKMLDYYMQKYSDDIYSAAEAMSILGRQAQNTFQRINILQGGVNNLLSMKGMSLDSFNGGLISGDFTSNDISQLREWRDGLINANLELLKMEQNVRQQIESSQKEIKSLQKSIRDTEKNIKSLEKQIKEANEQIEELKLEQDVAALEKINEKLTKQNELIREQNDLFNRYSNILQTYKDITNLMGKAVNRNQEKLIDDLNNALLHNSKNTMIMAKRSMEDLAKQRLEIEQLLGKAVNENNEEMVEKYKDILKQMDQEVQNYEQQYLTAWQNTMNQAQQIFETTVDNILDDFDKGLSGAFGSLDYLKQAFDRQSDIDGQYLKDYDKLYELNKMQRDLNKTLSNTTNADTRADLLALQKEINLYQQQGVQLSKYDIDALKAKIALQQSYNDLQVSQNAKNTVRLTRDAGGNWGYVYTANTDDIAKAEQSYEDKLKAYQKLNDDYLNELQNKVIEVQTTYRDYLKEILTDMSLSDLEREARIKELNNWLSAQQSYFNQQSQGAFKQQSFTIRGMTNYYKVFSQDILDSWNKTKLATLTGADSLSAYMNLWTGSSTTLLDDLTEALSNRRKDLDEILQLSGTNILSWGETVQGTIDNVGKASDDVNYSLISLSEVINTSFAEAAEEYSKKIADVREQIDDYNDSLSDAHDSLNDYIDSLAKANDKLSAAQSWQRQYAGAVKEMIAQNERFIESLNRLIVTLANTNMAQNQISNIPMANTEIIYDEIVIDESGRTIELWKDGIRYNSNGMRFDTGGYTGEWGPEGKLAILDEKEQVFNANDTANLLEAATILRKIDMSAFSMIASLGKIASPSIDKALQTIQQEVHIEASFPNANNHYEIEEAFNNLSNKAIQYVNRKNNL